MKSVCRRALSSRGLCSVSRRLASDPTGASFWRTLHLGKVLPELDSQLEAARKAFQQQRKTSDGTANAYESRSALAVALSKRWKADQVSAYKSDGNVTANYALRVDDDVELGFLKCTIWPEGPDGFKTALIHSLQCDPALPLALAQYPLVTKAMETLTSEDIGVKRVLGIVPLPGLCAWLVNERAWERVVEGAWHDEAHTWEAQRAAVEAVARGEPLDGQSPFDEQTLAAAKLPIEGMALEYAAIEDVDAECTAMALARGRLAGIHWLHDKSEEALRSSVGCTASFEFATDDIKHIDIDDEVAVHIVHTPHPAEGNPGRW